MKIKLEFKWQDLWIGVYPEKKLLLSFSEMKIAPDGIRRYLDTIRTWERHIWICIVPCLPIHIWWEIDPKEGRRGVIA